MVALKIRYQQHFSPQIVQLSYVKYKTRNIIITIQQKCSGIDLEKVKVLFNSFRCI